MELGGLWWTNVLNLALPPQRDSPDSWLEHQEPVITRFRRKGRKKERKKEREREREGQRERERERRKERKR